MLGLTSFLLKTVEQKIAQQIQRYTELEGALSSLASQNLLLYFTDLNFFLLIEFEPQAVYLHKLNEPLAATCTLSGKSADFINFLKKAQRGQPLSFAQFKTEGNTEFLQQAFAFFLMLMPNMEAFLTEYLGIWGGTITSRSIKKFSGLFKEFKQSWVQSTKEYLQEEKKIFPSPHRYQNFQDRLQEARFSLDRLEARLNLIEAKTKNEH